MTLTEWLDEPVEGRITRKEFCEKIGIHRQALWELENGNKVLFSIKKLQMIFVLTDRKVDVLGISYKK